MKDVLICYDREIVVAIQSGIPISSYIRLRIWYVRISSIKASYRTIYIQQEAGRLFHPLASLNITVTFFLF